MLTPQRRRELALIALEYAVLKDPMEFAFGQRRRFCEIAEKLHILSVHLEMLLQPMYQKAMNRTFTTPQKPCEIPTDEVSGNLAYAVLKEVISRRKIKIHPNTVRELGDIATEVHVPVTEVIEFTRHMYQELVDAMFAKN
jgi:hypothetical protein